MKAWQRLKRFAKGLMMRYVPGMITCARFDEFVIDYYEDRLSPNEKAIFEWHLKMCRDCRSYLAAYRRAIETGKKLFQAPAASVPDTVPEDLVQAILATRRAESGRSGKS
jgi:anti-sigma factor RsiW